MFPAAGFAHPADPGGRESDAAFSGADGLVSAPAWPRRVDRAILAALALSSAAWTLSVVAGWADPAGGFLQALDIADAPELPDGGEFPPLESVLAALGLLRLAFLAPTWRRRRRRPPPEDIAEETSAAAPCAAASPRLPLRDAGKVLAVWLATPLWWGWLGGVADAFTLFLGGIAGSAAAAAYALVLWRRRGGSWRVLWSGGPESPPIGAALRRAADRYLQFFPAVWLASRIGERLFGPLSQDMIRLLLWLGDRPAAFLTAMALAVAAAPAAEEIMFRLTLHGVLRRRLPAWALVAVSGLAFAAIHFDLRAFLPLAALGCFWAWRRERSGGLSEPILLHMTNNALSMFSLLLALGT